jgi:hypothetical protein
MPQGNSRRGRVQGAVLLVGLALLLAPALALADGGQSIASAPVAPYGVQQFGNTATGAKDSHDVYRSFWAVNVLAGDELIVDWQSVTRATELVLKPVGTTDFTVLDTDYADIDGLDANNKSQLRYLAPLSGLMPLYFESCCSFNATGPYSFVASVKHAIFTSLTPRAGIRPMATLTGTAVMADGTPVPDGLTFILSAHWSSRGLAQFSGTSSGGTLSFPVALPPEAERRKVKFDISRGTDESLLATKSTSMEVYVGRAVAPASPPAHKRRKCRKGFKKHKVHGKTKCVRRHHR